MGSIVEAVLLPAGAYTTTQTLDPIAIASAAPLVSGFMGIPRLLEIIIDTQVFGTGSVTVTIQEFDQASGTWAVIDTTAAIVAVGRTRLVVGWGVPVTADSSRVAMGIPKRWRVVATANNGNSQTYSITGRIVSE